LYEKTEARSQFTHNKMYASVKLGLLRVFTHWSPNSGKRVKLPTALVMFPKDMIPGSREWVARKYNIQYWTKMPKGSHFAEMEEPELMVEYIKSFFSE